ncbi:uncharacterized protein LOC132738645 [Ruditapes philippinarum]|uniref:uncharacterized protein LOC132738645 n=1 Tax=Ruditapes philippinarum TaxID=129788 RepID=UPI00295BD021|nr:uncharacterized protein LOC132738645 [Ruditapes philippinarum]
MFSFQIFILFLNVWIIQSDDSSEGSIKDIVRDELQDLRLEFARTNSRLQRLTLAMESFPSDTAAMKDQLKELKRRAGFLEKKLYSTLQDLLSERQNRIEMTSSFERKIAILEEKVDELWTETSIKIADGDSQRKFAKYWSEKFKSLKENTEVMIFRSMNDTRSEVSQLKQALSRTNSKNDKQEVL